ncbi:hypothetical protein SAMN02745136_02962 [Anaerocolumna jejuensis DSM 15929]|uniref:Uncharacterized protein n=1 Tax=Anaerocolumna jejuensis DSM 15929 TaxID=1121322 RepID=A0A1M6U2C4_9FIRM|nr:hypothetical protein [Anaerocolumna jejuensis]SHK63294.1 hypothetical protein SAMN02745136_02962 [Anaerocolumna jejuensis DSM 15929]
MKKSQKKGTRLHYNYFFVMSMIFIALIVVSARKVQATENDVIVLDQYHSTADYRYQNQGLGEYFYDIYPNPYNLDYKKFMKFTYVISDDSVFGLKANTNSQAASLLLADASGNARSILPYNISVYALGPGTATLKVYDGKKLVDTFNIIVLADNIYSPSSYVDMTEDSKGNCISYTDTKTAKITAADIKKENDLIKKFIKIAADPKNTTTSQRIHAALNAVINHGSTQIFDKNYKELNYLSWKKGITLEGKYRTAHSMLIEKQSLSLGFAIVNKAVLNNLGFNCTIEQPDGGQIKYGCDVWNSVELNQYVSNSDQDETAEDNAGIKYAGYIDFGAAAKLLSDDDFSRTDADLIYRKGHLPAWIVGEDTQQQVIRVGDTQKLSACDLNNNIYSSDTSVVTVQDGSITGVNPGVAVVYRYNDTYCDVFYVLVKKKGSVKTINSKIYTKATKEYFKSSDYAPYIRGGQSDLYQRKDWEALRPFYLEQIFGNGSKLTTKYSKGKIECYLTTENESTLIYTAGSGD